MGSIMNQETKKQGITKDRSGGHVLYKRDDYDCPDCVCDSNGDVVLDLCRYCGKGEVELEEPCWRAIPLEAYRQMWDKVQRLNACRCEEDAMQVIKTVTDPEIIKALLSVAYAASMPTIQGEVDVLKGLNHSRVLRPPKGFV